MKGKELQRRSGNSPSGSDKDLIPAVSCCASATLSTTRQRREPAPPPGKESGSSKPIRPQGDDPPDNSIHEQQDIDRTIMAEETDKSPQSTTAVGQLRMKERTGK